MFELVGKYNTAVVQAESIDETTREQILGFLNHPAFARTHIVIMPDCHAGAGAVIGFTAKMTNYIIPNVVGVDIGCGVIAYRINTRDIDLPALDNYIKQNIPLGFHHRQRVLPGLDMELLDVVDERANRYGMNRGDVPCQLGTLGGGNHFIEVDKDDDDGECWLTIHTGSRNFGLRIANYWQGRAKKLMEDMLIDTSLHKGLEYLPWEMGGYDYYVDMRIAQRFAHANREVIAEVILNGFFKQDAAAPIESVHNYISDEDNIIRKGAVSAHEGEAVIIPFNMRDGIALCRGKGNRSWNQSAPHGAGRLFSRTEARRQLDPMQFQLEMQAAGIYTTTANDATLDEAPGAYKSKDSIVAAISETVTIERFLRPIYSIKAGGD